MMSQIQCTMLQDTFSNFSSRTPSPHPPLLLSGQTHLLPPLPPLMVHVVVECPLTDIGSAQNRFCGTLDNVNIGGIAGNKAYTSESNQLVLWFKSNKDAEVGTGFTLTWEAV